jgi:hypothetical protein
MKMIRIKQKNKNNEWKLVNQSLKVKKKLKEKINTVIMALQKKESISLIPIFLNTLSNVPLSTNSNSVNLKKRVINPQLIAK